MKPAGRGAGMRRAALAALAIGLAASAAVAEPVFTRVELPAEAADEPLDAEWHLPDGAAPSALVVLQHGFTRRCAHLRTLAAALAESGVATVCLNAEMTRGNPVLARAWVDRLLATGDDALRLPGGGPLPRRIVVAGHSAGAHFAAIAGEHLDARAPQRLAGALLLDPVSAGPAFATALAAGSDEGRRPVHALLAEPHACNARGNARPALLAIRDRARAAGRDVFVGLRLVGGTHADAEGPDSDTLAGWVCGRAQPAVVETLRRLSVQWVQAMAGPVQARSTPPLTPPAETAPIE